VIDELADELENECSQWRGDSSISPDDPSEWHYEPSVELPKHLQTLLGVQFPHDMKDLLVAVQIRHDLVHRDGRTPDGNEITLTPGQVTGLIKIVQNLVDGIEAQQTELRVCKMPF